MKIMLKSLISSEKKSLNIEKLSIHKYAHKFSKILIFTQNSNFIIIEYCPLFPQNDRLTSFILYQENICQTPAFGEPYFVSCSFKNKLLSTRKELVQLICTRAFPGDNDGACSRRAESPLASSVPAVRLPSETARTGQRMNRRHLPLPVPPAGGPRSGGSRVLFSGGGSPPGP